MTSRYDTRIPRANFSPQYRQIFKERAINFVNQYGTAVLKYPSPSEINELVNYSHVWKLGDRFYKLADQYYKDPTLWWVIAWYNRTPTESHVSIGDVVIIPLPLEKTLQFLEV